MNHFKKLLLCSVLLSISSQAHASKWGTAGCGVGSLIFEDKPGKIQLLAGTTNEFFGQTYSITTGTSNCTEAAGREEAMMYINANQKPLAKDVSRGQGETLSGLAKVLGCSNQERLGFVLQKNYKSIFSGSTPESIAESIESSVQSDEQMSGKCSLFVG
ncbi:DUF3015 domain-containing protein [bacterium]|nr:DUF3015 domain-containing protein [bacterium]